MRALPLLLVLAATQSSTDAQRLPFLSIVARYQAGQTKEAIEALFALGRHGLNQSNEAIVLAARGQVHLDARAAAMLHTDAAEVFWRINKRLALSHVDRARAWADAAEGDAPFRSHWYLAAGLLLVEAGVLDENIQPAFDHFEHACRVLPDDVSLLTVTAWLEERSALAAVSTNRPMWAATDPSLVKHQHLGSAERRLEAVLEIDPLLAEATLRLGRVRMLRGDHEGAVRLLEPLVARKDIHASIAYASRLFLARAMEETANPARAIELYREAIARMPAASSARMGLARLLYASNEVRAATEVLDPAMSAATSPAEQDPWRGYLTTYVERAAAFRRMLRKEVQR